MTKLGNNKLALYVDESVHTNLGFIATAFIFSDNDVEGSVSRALRSVGLQPLRDEFKSGALMAGNAKMRALREDLLHIASRLTRVALFFNKACSRRQLGEQCLRGLELILRRNGIRPDQVTAYFDKGIYQSATKAARVHKSLEYLHNMRLEIKDSRICLGIQVADAVAHSAAQIIREALTGTPKFVDIGGPDTGYPDDIEAKLSWVLLMTLRYSFFTRPIVFGEKPFDLETFPIILGRDEDPVNTSIMPELVGWGVQVAENAGDQLRNVVYQTLGRIWLGCIH